MKINTKIRLKVVRRILRRLWNYYNTVGPYGFVDQHEIYKNIEHWESIEDELMTKYESRKKNICFWF